MQLLSTSTDVLSLLADYLCRTSGSEFNIQFFISMGIDHPPLVKSR